MTPKVILRSGDFMESQNENDSFHARIIELENENQNLRAQALLQNNTIVELRNELMLLRIRLNELSDTSALLRERVRALAQNAQHRENEGLVIAPPLMAPPPAPPPLPSGRVRISPRQVGAGEALTTPLGISLSAPPRHRVKRDYRQGVFRPVRNNYRRLDLTEPGTSSQTPVCFSDRANYFVGLKIIPQFQSVDSQKNSNNDYNDSASDSSGSDENSQLTKKTKTKSPDEDPALKKTPPDSEEVLNVETQRIQNSILQNYNFALPKPEKFFFPLPWRKKSRDNSTLPSTSGNEVECVPTSSNITRENNSYRNGSKLSNCAQYTFPKIHEGLHHSGVSSVVTSGSQNSRLRKLKKNIPYVSSKGGEDEDQKSEENGKIDSESLLSLIEANPPSVSQPGELTWDCEQDGFQADESSNCMTSTDTSLEKISISESNMEKKD